MSSSTKCRSRSSTFVVSGEPARDKGGRFRRAAACQRGHRYTSKNTYVHPATGKRRCLTCHNAARRARYAAEKSGGAR